MSRTPVTVRVAEASDVAPLRELWGDILRRGGLDEPSMGLAPKLIQQIFDIITEISQQGTTILVVEQNAKQALTRSDRAYVLETGRIVKTGSGTELLDDPSVREAYLGVA